MEIKFSIPIFNSVRDAGMQLLRKVPCMSRGLLKICDDRAYSAYSVNLSLKHCCDYTLYFSLKNHRFSPGFFFPEISLILIYQ